MRILLVSAVGVVLSIALAGCGNPSESSAVMEKIVEVGCGSCSYKIDGVEECVTAVKIGDTPYLVTGADLDAHSSGLCESVKQAKVTGEIQDGKFVASAIALVNEK